MLDLSEPQRFLSICFIELREMSQFYRTSFFFASVYTFIVPNWTLSKFIAAISLLSLNEKVRGRDRKRSKEIEIDGFNVNTRYFKF